MSSFFKSICKTERMQDDDNLPKWEDIISISEFKRCLNLSKMDDEMLRTLGKIIQRLPDLNSSHFLNRDMQIVKIERFYFPDEEMDFTHLEETEESKRFWEDAERKNIVGKNE